MLHTLNCLVPRGSDGIADFVCELFAAIVHSGQKHPVICGNGVDNYAKLLLIDVRYGVADIWNDVQIPAGHDQLGQGG